MEHASQTTILGKRKASGHGDALVLHLSPTTNSSTSLPEQESDQDTPQASSSKTQHIIVNGTLVPKTKKCYQCTFEGCDRSYSKPSRLEEHQRSHTGQRPFSCETCGKSYLRETHLTAHTRSHLPESARPFVCERDGCGKRFWTTQHLKVHSAWHDGAKLYKCNEADCQESFAKHHQLRAHICSEHSPPGTKPYICDHEGCTKSFDTNQHLRTHQKTHDDKRYACSHVNCLPSDSSSPKYFSTWSALQSHIRTDHPPVCTHPSCAGKKFASQANLRAHIKLHEEREADKAFVDDADSGNETDRPPKKKRRGGEHGRDWKCQYDGCEKDFKSKNALNTHTNVTHLGKRDFVCPHAACGSSFGYKHLLQRHLVRCHGVETSGPETSQDDLSEGEDEATFDIDAMTGNAYAKRADTRLKEAKALRCPFPQVQDLVDVDALLPPNATHASCDYVFNRAYDLRRHLNATHDLVCSKEVVDTWVRREKRKIHPTL
ncbi:hypothetical protein D9613_000365 [Agrocybe pediades]|uniref:C2H2-type domain-containing protein n=1 Tax=Agrocybe pediades TaxID=84607 RepID=A0A8H4R2I8_9AGAR|nr:hypothetical protein D9613_000365 [Agrocybe pediades]